MSRSAPRVLNAAGLACPFLRAAAAPAGGAVPTATLPTLVAAVGHQCPYLRREGVCASRACPAARRAATDTLVSAQLARIRAEGRYRVFWDINRRAGRFPHAACVLDAAQTTQRDVTVWCNNDYLGMGQHPKVLAAMKDAIDRAGAGAGGTRNISGTSSYHTALERRLATLHRHEAALVFSSGFVANEAVLNALGQLPNAHFFSDADNHASMIAGIRNSRAAKHIWRHNDAAHLDELLAAAPPDAPKIVVFESVYSMDGDVVPLERVLDVAEKHGAYTMIDEVHAVGLYGERGAGIAERDDLQARVTLVSATLGKAFGCFGGYVTGPAELLDYVRSVAPGFIFTTALPPAVAAGAAASVDVVMSSEGGGLRREHQARAARLKDLLADAGLPVLRSQSHIVPLIVGDARLCKMASDRLLSEHGIYVQPINYPTVPRGTERLRLTPSPLHTDAQMHHLRRALLDVWAQLDIPPPNMALVAA